MIGLPFDDNDLACLSAITEVVADLAVRRGLQVHCAVRLPTDGAWIAIDAAEQMRVWSPLRWFTEPTSPVPSQRGARVDPRRSPAGTANASLDRTTQSAPVELVAS